MRDPRAVACLIVLLLVVLLTSGCGGGGGTTSLIRQAPKIRIFLRPPTVTTIAAADHAAVIAQGGEIEQVASALRRLGQDAADPVRMLKVSFCSGIEQVASWDDPNAVASSETWRSYLIEVGSDLSADFVGQYLAPLALAATVDDFMTGIDLAGINPQIARGYLQACVLSNSRAPRA
jgi:hypothetical protein